MEDAAAARDHPDSRPADPQTGATSYGIRPRVLSAIRYLTAHNTPDSTAGGDGEGADDDEGFAPQLSCVAPLADAGRGPPAAPPPLPAQTSVARDSRQPASVSASAPDNANLHGTRYRMDAVSDAARRTSEFPYVPFVPPQTPRG